MPTVRIPRQFQIYTKKVKLLTLKGASLREVLVNLTQGYPALIGPVFSNDLQPLPFVGLFIDGSIVEGDIDFINALRDDAELVIINAVAGG